MDKNTIYHPHYLTFPMAILKDGLRDINAATRDVFAYHLFQEASKYIGLHSKDRALSKGADVLGLTFGNINWSYDRGQLLNSIQGPKTSITVKMLIDFHINQKEEFEVVTFLAFAAIKSIIQKQKYTKITNKYLLGRMVGNAK